MIPLDLPSERIVLPPTQDRGIVLLSGTDLRHWRFGLRMQQAFGPLVRAWFMHGGSGVSLAGRTRLERARILAGLAADSFNRARRRSGVLGALRTVLALRRRRAAQIASEERLFRDEVEALRPVCPLAPETVADFTAPSFTGRVRELSPWLLLVFGGPLLKGDLLAQVRGLAVNQHAGWSPDYKGSRTIDWTLYRRDLDRVGATVHLIAPAADAGPILRRAAATLQPADDPADCFNRVTALGTELMIAAVGEILRDGAVTVHHQPPGAGRTYRAAELDGAVLDATARDFRRGWLAEALAARRRDA